MANTLINVSFLFAVVFTAIICVQGSSRYARSKSDNTCIDALWGGDPCQSPGGSSKEGGASSKASKDKKGGASKAKGAGRRRRTDLPECDYCNKDRLICKPSCDENGLLTDECPSGCCRDAHYCWDINECHGDHGCPSLNSYCVNTAGSFECGCIEGYKLNDEKTECEGINECELYPLLCKPYGICSDVDTPPGYSCTCLEGYEMDSDGACIASCQQNYTPNKYEYQYIWQEIPDGVTEFDFRVKAKNDAHISLSAQREDLAEMYEIVIGGWNNGKSVLRLCKQCTNKDTYNGPIVSESEFTDFYISFEDDLIKVGLKGQAPFMSYQNTESWEVNYIGISTGWGSTGLWEFCGYDEPEDV